MTKSITSKAAKIYHKLYPYGNFFDSKQVNGDTTRKFENIARELDKNNEIRD